MIPDKPVNPNDMTIREMNRLRCKIAREMTDLLRYFESQTGVYINGIEVVREPFTIGGLNGGTLAGVMLKVNL